MDRGAVLGRYPKLFASPSKRERELEQEVEALRLSMGIAASLKPSSDGSLAAGHPDPNQNHPDPEKEPGQAPGDFLVAMAAEG